MHKYASAAFDPGFRVGRDFAVTSQEALDFEAKIQGFLESNFTTANRVVVKDPRITALADFWLHAAMRIGYRISVIFMFRHPQRVAASLHDRDELPPEHAIALWLKYNLVGERATRLLPRVFVEFEELLDDWRSTLDRVNGCLGLNVTLDAAKSERLDQLLDHKEPREVPLARSTGERWIAAAYEWLQSAAEDPSCDVTPMDECFDDVVAAETLYRVSYESYVRRFQPKATPALIAQQLRQLREQLDLCEDILLAKSPATEKWARILDKIRSSPWRSSPALPKEFDARRYVTRHRDLFDHEVDPFRHYLDHGIHEQISWAAPREALKWSLDLQSMESLLSRYQSILQGEAQITAKFASVRRKIENSPHRNSPRLPNGFKPLRYACLHLDLWEAEEDPFAHYQAFGSSEGRHWDFSAA
jgi:hypothetical protein